MSFNFMSAATICSDSGAQENKTCHCFHCFPIYLPWNDGTRCHDIREISPEYSLEGLMLTLKLQYFGHLIQRALGAGSANTWMSLEEHSSSEPAEQNSDWPMPSCQSWDSLSRGPCLDPDLQRLWDREPHGQRSLAHYNPGGYMSQTWPSN